MSSIIEQMQFQDFLKYIPKIAKEKLLAEDAHAKMAPLERVSFLKKENYLDKNPKEAAVLMLFYPKKSETNLALIVRNSYPGSALFTNWISWWKSRKGR